MRQPDIDTRGLSGRHVVQYYDSPAYLADSVAQFLTEGLRAGEGVVVVCTARHRELIEECLEAYGTVVANVLRTHDLRFLDAADTLDQLMPGEQIDLARFESLAGKMVWQSSRGGHRSVRLYGEMVSLLCERGKFEEAARLEWLWNDIMRRESLSLYCAYRISQFGHEGLAHHFEHICDAHDEVLPSEEWMRLDQRTQLRRVADLERQAARHERILVELQDALKKQAETDRHKDEFLAMLGHELRNPLAPIFTALQLMSLRGDPVSTREREVIRRQANHLTHLVDDLLDVSRIARGKIKLEKVPIELAKLMARAVEVASPVFEERRHHLTISVPRSGLIVDADVVRLSQVLANLLGNAAKYTDPGGRISIVGHRSGSEIVVEVTDNGNGIAPDLLPTIFDVFVQGDRSIDRAKGGLGLGLALVKNLTQLHGGSVSAHSDGLGKGSTFVLRLPASDTVSAIKAPVATPSEKRRAASVPGHRVLLVDDNQDAASVLAEVLRLRGCEVTVAHDGLQALSLANNGRHDIALVDLGLPVMDGYELAERLREGLGLEAPKLIAVTGYGQESDRARTHQAGFVAHLVKPVGLEDLLETIARA
jgi:signal transduction histidine kinase/BarA-like signal transduction histidine kinase